EYSHPCTLFTDTHYLVFETSSEIDDSTNRNCSLDAIVLYEKDTDIELKRIVFDYADTNNSNDPWPVPSPGNQFVSNDWQSNERLNNNQLTLIGFTIKKVGPILPKRQDGNDEEIQKYYFTYTKNPHIDLEKISTW